MPFSGIQNLTIAMMTAEQKPERIQTVRDLPIPIDNFQVDPETLRRAQTIPIATEVWPPRAFLDMWVSIGRGNTSDQIRKLARLCWVTTVRINSSKFSSAETLAATVAEARQAKSDTKICLDLSGPKVRTIKFPSTPELVKTSR